MTTFNTKEFGRRVKSLRLTKGLSQDQLAEALNTTMTHLSKLETGVRGPSLQIVLSLHEYFDVSTDYILGVQLEMQQDLSAGMDAIIAACTALRAKM